MALSETDVENLIQEERRRQIAKWGGMSHDQRHSAGEWQDYIRDHATKALNAETNPTPELFQRIVQVAALGYAVSDCLDELHAVLTEVAYKADGYGGGMQTR